MTSKNIKLQRWYNRKNIFSWEILQKLPSKKHKTHRTYHSLENTFLSFYNFELFWKVSRHAKPFHSLRSKESQNCDCFSLGKKSVLGQSHRRHFAQNRRFCCLATNIRLAEKIGEDYSIVRNAKNVNKNRKKNIHPQSFLQKLPKTSRAPGKLHQKQGSILLFLPEEQEQVPLNLQLSRSFLNLTKM